MVVVGGQGVECGPWIDHFDADIILTSKLSRRVRKEERKAEYFKGLFTVVSTSVESRFSFIIDPPGFCR